MYYILTPIIGKYVGNPTYSTKAGITSDFSAPAGSTTTASNLSSTAASPPSWQGYFTVNSSSYISGTNVMNNTWTLSVEWAGGTGATNVTVKLYDSSSNVDASNTGTGASGIVSVSHFWAYNAPDGPSAQTFKVEVTGADCTIKAGNNTFLSVVYIPN